MSKTITLPPYSDTAHCAAILDLAFPPDIERTLDLLNSRLVKQ